MELEAKWEPRGQLTADQIEVCPWQPYTLGPRIQLAQTNQYYDTPDWALRRARRSLRLRNENGRLLVTIKGGGQVLDGVHQRDEQEEVVASADPASWPAAIREVIEPLLGQQQLRPFLRIDNQRQAWPVLHGRTLIGELALDTGTIVVGERSEPLHELEWEFKGGVREDFDAVGTIIRDHLPVVPSDVTKLQRGMALLEATPPPMPAQGDVHE